MKKILLVIDGSAEARYAAETSWALAQKCGYAVTAQYVVDRSAVWNFLQYSLAGFTGSGPFFSVFETICQSLKDLGITLTDIYCAHADALGIEGSCVIDEGETLSEIKRRAADHDLVVLGQRSSHLNGNRRSEPRSLCELLAGEIDCPLLLVRRPCSFWQNVRILTGIEGIKESSMEAILQFSSRLEIKPELICIDNHSQTPKELQDRLRDCISPARIKSNDINRKAPGSRINVPDNTLLAIPSIRSESGRVTSYGGELNKIIQNMELPAVLIWPPIEERKDVNAQIEPDLSISSGHKIA